MFKHSLKARKKVNLKGFNETLNKLFSRGYYSIQECIYNRGFMYQCLKKRKKNTK